MEREELLNELSELGYSLVAINKSAKANQILAEVVKSREPRLWQGFPIVLSNCLKSGSFSYDETMLNLSNEVDKKNFQILVNMSLALFRHLKINTKKSADMYKFNYFNSGLFDRFLDDFARGERMHILGNILSPTGIINTFRRYSKGEDININVAETIRVNDYVNIKEEFDIDFAISQLFSKKQKDLLLKKMRGAKMTKTEREYYSRSVRRKILAIANPVLHRLALTLLKD